MSKLFYTSSQVAALIGVSSWTVRRWTTETPPKIKSSVIDNKHYFVKEDIENYAVNNLPQKCFEKIKRELDKNQEAADE